MHTWTPIKVFSFWLDWEGQSWFVGTWEGRGQSWKYWRRWYVWQSTASAWGALEGGGEKAKIWKPCFAYRVVSSGPRWQAGYWVSEEQGNLSFPLWNALQLQQFGVAWRGHSTSWHTGKPRTQCLWRAAFFPRSSGNWHSRCRTELQGSSCPQWVQTSPWAPVRTALQLEGGRVGLEKYNSVIIRELQTREIQELTSSWPYFVCELVRPVYSGSSWVQTANNAVKAGWLRSALFRSWN